MSGLTSNRRAFHLCGNSSFTESDSRQLDMDTSALTTAISQNDERTTPSHEGVAVGRRWTSARVLGAMLIAGAAVRLLLIWSFHGQPLYDDEIHYHQIAVNLVTTGQFAQVRGTPTSMRPPLYPFMVAGIYGVFGIDGQDAVRAIQAVLSLLTVVVVYFLGRDMFTSRVGLWAAGICCFYPSLVASNIFVLTETLFTFLLGLFCLITIRSWNRHSASGMALAGVVLGLAALTRSVMWLFPPVLALFILLALRELSWLRRVVLAFAPFVTFAMTITPWAVRNTHLQETFTTIDTMGGRNFMMGNYEHTPLDRPWATISIQGDASWDSVLSAEAPGYRETTQGQRDKLALRRTLNYISHHPALTLKRSVVKFLHFWQLDRSLVAGAASDYWGHWPKPALIGLTLTVCGASAAVIIATMFGVFMLPGLGDRRHWFALLIVLFVCGIHTLVFAHARYRLPLMPILAVFAASAMVNLRGIWSHRRDRRFWLATGLCGVLIASWCWQFSTDVDKLSTLIGMG